jgi:hypothetical protein
MERFLYEYFLLKQDDHKEGDEDMVASTDER